MEDLVIPTLQTERLRLRSFRASDFDDYAAMCADPEVARGFAGGVPFSREESWWHMAFLVGHWQLWRTGTWAIEEKASGAFVGRIGFTHLDDRPELELSWALACRWWGRGYATEGARAALAYAFTTLGEARVISLIPPENRASIRVAERLGENLLDSAKVLGKEHLVYAIDRYGPS